MFLIQWLIDLYDRNHQMNYAALLTRYHTLHALFFHLSVLKLIIEYMSSKFLSFVKVLTLLIYLMYLWIDPWPHLYLKISKIQNLHFISITSQ